MLNKSYNHIPLFMISMMVVLTMTFFVVPDASRYLFWAILLIFMLAIAFVTSKKTRERRQFFLQERESMSLENMFEEFYSEGSISKEVFKNAMELVASHYQIPISKLRPFDNFFEDLEPEPWIVSDVSDELSTIIRQRYNDQIDPSTIKTIDEYIRAVDRIEKNPTSVSK